MVTVGDNASGTSSVEFALVLPLLLIIVLGTVEVGLLILSHAGLNTAISMVQDVAKNANGPDELQQQINAINSQGLGFGFTKVIFEEIEEFCICPHDAISWVESRSTCPITCSQGQLTLRMFEVQAHVTVPSFMPSNSGIGLRTVETQIIVFGP